MKVKKFALALVCAGWVLTLARPAAARQGGNPSGGLSLELIMKSPFPSELVAAPRGNAVAWVFNAEGKRNIWLAVAPAFAARQLTRYAKDDGQEISGLSFSSDGRTLVFVRGGNKNQAGEVPNPSSDPEGVEQAVWAVSVAGGAPRKIDPGHSPRASARGWVAYVKDDQIWIAPLRAPGKPRQVAARGRNSSPVWSPDGRKLAFVSNRTTHALIAIYDPAAKSLGYAAPSVDRDSTPRWSFDGRALAFVRRPAETQAETPGAPAAVLATNPWAIWVADLASSAAREVWRSTETPEGSLPPMAGDALLNWAADGRLVFASEQDGWQHLYSIPASGGAPVLLTPGECEYEQMTFTPDRREVVFASNCGDVDRRHLWRVAVAGGAPQPVTSGEGIEWAPVVTSGGRWLAHFASTARFPAMPHFRALAGNGKPGMIAARSLPQGFPSDRLVVPQQVVFHAPDGTRIHNQLFLPADLKPGERRPAVVFMHGGPRRQMMLGWHNRGYYHRAYALNQYLASRGYVVLSVNYRGGISYGRAFREAENRGARGASEYQDIAAAGRYLQGRPDVDPARIGLWGGSYGGYLTALGLARDSSLFAAGVDLHGVHTRGPGTGGGNPTPERRRLAWESSPVADVEKWRSPVLLVHGDDDRNVEFAQTVDLAARLRRQNVAFEEIIFPDEVHDFLRHAHWVRVYAAAADFFERHLKGASMRAAQ